MNEHVGTLLSPSLSFPVHKPEFPGLPGSSGSGLTAYEHRADGEDLLGISVGTHVAKAHTGEAAQREVQRRDVGAAPRRSTRRAVDIGLLQPLAQLMQPTWDMEGWRELGLARQALEKASPWSACLTWHTYLRRRGAVCSHGDRKWAMLLWLGLETMNWV